MLYNCEHSSEISILRNKMSIFNQSMSGASECLFSPIFQEALPYNKMFSCSPYNSSLFCGAKCTFFKATLLATNSGDVSIFGVSYLNIGFTITRR